MRTAPKPVPAAVWCAPDGLPRRMVIGGERWRIADIPTPLDVSDSIHGGALLEGWRATIRRDSDSMTEVIDLARHDDEGWLILNWWR